MPSLSHTSPGSGVQEGKGRGHQGIRGGFKTVVDGFIDYLLPSIFLYLNAKERGMDDFQNPKLCKMID